MLQVRGLIVLTEPPIRRVAKNGATFATCRATVPAVEPNTTPLELNVVAFGALAPRLLATPAGTLVGIEGTLAMTAWRDRDGTERRNLRLTVHIVECLAAGAPARLEPPHREPVP